MNTKSELNRGRCGRAVAPALAGAMLILASTPGVLAQRASERRVPKALPAPATPAASSPGRSFHGSYTVSSDGEEVRVVSDGKHAEVRLNGVLITTLDLSDDWTRFAVENADGEVIATVVRPWAGAPSLSVYVGDAEAGEHVFGNAPFGGVARTWTFSPEHNDLFQEIAEVRGQAGQARPKVMIGVFLEGMDRDDAADAGVDPGAVTMITGVAEGGPAAKAGLRAGDVIADVEGLGDGDLTTIRDALREKKPGDTLSLTVLRDGQPKRFALALEAYDGAVFGQPEPPVAPTAPAPPLVTFLGPEQAALNAKLAALGAKLGKLGGELGTAHGARADEIREEMDRLGKVMAELGARLERNRWYVSPESNVEVDIREGDVAGERKIVLKPRMRFGASGEAFPSQLEAYQVQLEDLSDRIDESLDEIDERMDELEERIDRKLNELVEELLRRMRDRAE